MKRLKYVKLFEKFRANDFNYSYQINEGIIRLTTDEKNQLNTLINKIEKIIRYDDFSNANVIVKGPVGSEDEISGIKSIEVGEFKYLFADKKEGVLKVYVSDCKSVPEKLRRGDLGFAWYRPNDPKNLEDGQIVINALEFQPGFLEAWEERHKEKLRSVLTHEIIHAKDPNFNHLKGKDTTKDYSSRDEEIKAFTAQFIDLIENKIEKWIKINSDKMNDQNKQKEIDMIGQILNNLLLIFARNINYESMNTNILNFIEDFNLNIDNLNKRFKFGTDEFENFHKVYGSKVLIPILSRLLEIKKNEPKRYKKFLGSLYKSIGNLFNEINKSIGKNLKPIKINTNLDDVKYSW